MNRVENQKKKKIQQIYSQEFTINVLHYEKSTMAVKLYQIIMAHEPRVITIIDVYLSLEYYKIITIFKKWLHLTN